MVMRIGHGWVERVSPPPPTSPPPSPIPALRRRVEPEGVGSSGGSSRLALSVSWQWLRLRSLLARELGEGCDPAPSAPSAGPNTRRALPGSLAPVAAASPCCGTMVFFFRSVTTRG